MSVYAPVADLPKVTQCPTCQRQVRHVANRRGPKTWIVNARSHRAGRLWVKHDRAGKVVAQELSGGAAKAFVSARIPLYRPHNCEET